MKFKRFIYKSVFIILLLGLINFSDQCYGIENGEPFVHIMKKGESIYGISRQYNVSLDDLYKANPFAQRGVRPGDKLIIPGLTSNDVSITQDEKQITEAEDSKRNRIAYEIVKNDSDEKKTNETLPQVETEKKEEFEFDHLSESEINFEDSDSIVNPIEDGIVDNKIRIALLLDEPSSNKDIDFTRGVLVGLSEYKFLQKAIDLKILDSRVSPDSLTEELDAYEPTIIISTADKNFPAFLADYGNSNNIEIVNVFDLRNDLYIDNKSIIQILPPSKQYSSHIADGVLKEFPDKKVLFVGNYDDSDIIAKELKDKFPNNDEVSLEEFSLYKPSEDESVIIYSFATRKEDIYDFLRVLENIITDNSNLEFTVMGRSNWVAMTDEFEDRFKEFGVILPSRVWIDEDSGKWQLFIEKYEEMFQGVPIRSIPNYAASGYDIINYFVPILSENNIDFTRRHNLDAPRNIQTEISLNRENEESGLINKNVYLIRFRPLGIEKILIE